MKIQTVIQNTEKKTLFIAIIAAALFALSLGLYAAALPGRRHVLRFQSVDSGKNNVEWRLLPRKSGGERVSLYVDELLLGPKTERSRPLFSPGTKARFCFVRGRTLYVNLTPALLEKTGNASEIMYGIELFKKNIRRTFPGIKEIEIYIDNRSIL